VYTSKDKIRCVIVAEGWHIEGEIHLLAGSRLTDSLNSRTKDFIAMTNAIVRDAKTGSELYCPSYLAVHRSSIAVIFPIEDE